MVGDGLRAHRLYLGLRPAGRRRSRRTSQYRPRFPLLAFQLPETLVRPEAKTLRLFRLPARFLPKFPARASRSSL
jgi:hypothetical protein